MEKMNRRTILGTGLAIVTSAMTPNLVRAEIGIKSTEDKKSTENYGAGNTGLGLSKKLAEFTSNIQYVNLNPQAILEAKRATLDWLGCALIGCNHPTPKTLVSTFKSMGSFQAVRLIGNPGLKLSYLDAAIAHGQMGHILDFDDTHLGGVILHTSTATIPALLSLGAQYKSSGKQWIASIVAAFEGGIRTGQAMPNHHRGGWHLTGTLGTVAATIGSARILGLDAQKTLMALGIGCTQAAGMQQNRGSDCKSLHAGKSAYHGVLAASLAMNGFNSSPEILEGNLGFTKIYSTTQNLEALTKDLGREWMIAGNGYKPYSCGVVLHPLIDACIQLSTQSKIPPNEITSFEVLVHPDVIRITGVDEPGSGLMSKFSANHAATVAYIDRAGGVPQFTNERSQNTAIQGLRKMVQIIATPSLKLDQATARIKTKSGESFEACIEHAKGTVDNPMSDADLIQKFTQNAKASITDKKIERILDMVWNLENLADINTLSREYS